MIFGSDNWAGGAPQINQALSKGAAGLASAYEMSDLDQRVKKKFCEIFETECSVFYVATGTAANSLAIASAMRPGGVTFCHNEAHLKESEGSAPEFASGGGRLVLVDGDDAKINPAALKKIAKDYPPTFNHLGQGTMVSITQTTEGGTVYSLNEIDAISEVARANELVLHMDGARFANALVDLDCSPAEMTWKRGVDMVSFGATKNGCWCAEALVVFDKSLATQIEFIRKRMGHLFSKARFVSLQFEAYFEDDLWLELARHSNSIGIKLAEMVEHSPNVRLAWPSKTNQVFFFADTNKAEKWAAAGARFHPFPVPKALAGTTAENEGMYRLVASFIATEKDVADLKAVFAT